MGSINILISKAKTKGIIIGLVKLSAKAKATRAIIKSEKVISLLFSEFSIIYFF
tara:strand:- start:257 stop:418 length:162 start_codon:yes stop_codon:yes gene_type:complete